MKLDFEIQNSTQLEPNVVIAKILLMLKDKKYGVVGYTDKSVSFDGSSGGLIIESRGASFSRLKSGRFEIVGHEDHYVVKFEYRPLSLLEIIIVPVIFIIFSVFGIIIGTYFGILIGLPFLLQLGFKFFNLKSIAKEMLNDISIS